MNDIRKLLSPEKFSQIEEWVNSGPEAWCRGADRFNMHHGEIPDFLGIARVCLAAREALSVIEKMAEALETALSPENDTGDKYNDYDTLYYSIAEALKLAEPFLKKGE